MTGITPNVARSNVLRHSFAIVFLLFAAITPVVFGAENGIYTQRENVVFAQSHGLVVTMDIFTPKSEKNGLAIVDVASGGWSSSRSKIKDHKLAQMYNIFCKRGYVVFAVRPGSSSRFSATDMATHIEESIRWVKQRANDFKINPRRIGLTGASAGGHLATLVAMRNHEAVDEKNAGVAAVGVFFPPTDFLKWGEKTIDPTGDGELSQHLRALALPRGTRGLSEDEIRSRIEQISPARMVHEKLPPFLLIHGDADSVVPLQQSQRLAEELRKKEIPVQLIVKKDGGHPWLTIPVEVGRLADWFDTALRPTSHAETENVVEFGTKTRGAASD